MPRSKPDSENVLEQAAIALFADLGWRSVDAMNETYGSNSMLGRDSRDEVVLLRELRVALQQLNPGVPAAALDGAIEALTQDRSVLGMVQANREIYELLKNGVQVAFQGDDGEQASETVRVIDWAEPRNNRYLLVSQLWVTGEMYTRRTDLVGFVNGLPLLFLELKAHTHHLKVAYNGNFKDYKDTIRHLFWYNGLVMLSNGSDTRVGSISARWEHFAEWKRINDEGERGVISLEPYSTPTGI